MSDQWRTLRNVQTGEILLSRVRLCISFWCHFRGLQLAPRPAEDEGLLFVTDSESKTNTTIHMFFVLFSIAVVWLDSSNVVVDKKLAKPWRPAYAPRAPARYFIEANPDFLERVQIGDVLDFSEDAGINET
jgi:uncharacterized membrane protein (UPF0127 family)